MWDFLVDRPEWQCQIERSEDGLPCLSPPAFCHLVVWAQYQGLITTVEAEHGLHEAGARLAFLAEARRRIEMVDPR
jgi:hypothetical protein